MLVVAGVFYQAQVARLDPQNRSWLAEAASYPRAVEAVARSLRGYENVILNVANEHTVRPFETCPFPMRTVEGVVELCQAAKLGDPQRLVGGGGGHGGGSGGGLSGTNAALLVRPEVDLLLWDWGNPSPEAVATYRAVDARKPLMNVEVFGARAQGFVEVDAAGRPSWPGGGSTTPPPPSGSRRTQGVFPEGGSQGAHRGKADFLAEIAFAAQTPGFSLFGHFPAWCQGPSRDPSFDNRFDLGGAGTPDDPGIRWYFEAVARAQRG
ncbi:MAG: hypothetical protein ACRDI2_11290, partial [Chloroflexota bacterium]